MASKFDWKNLIKTPAQRRAEEEKKRLAEERKAERAAKKAEQTKKKTKTPKELATERGEPWVEIMGLDIDPKDPGNGSFELDWNDKFVSNLIRAGYQGKTDSDIVDNWFQTVCRNVALETYQQEQADPELRRSSNRKDIGNGRTEIS